MCDVKWKEHNFNKKQTLMCLYYSLTLSDWDEIYVNYHTTIFAIECCNPKNNYL